MVQRLITAVVGLPIVLGALWFGLPWLTILIGVVALLGLLEFAALARNLGALPSIPVLIAWGLAYILDAQFGGGHALIILTIGVLLSLAWQTLVVWRPGGLWGDIGPGPKPERIASFVVGWSFTVAGALYLGFTLAHALLIRELPHGREWLLLVIGTVFATDTLAFFTGKLLGRHKKASTISPGKTWEGAIGGTVGGIVAGLAIAIAFALPAARWQVVVLGSSIAVAAQLGDLAESMMKRGAGAKESSGLLPGHGGVLDRLDSIVVSVVVAYYAIRWIGA